jgi:hypothetical protein
MKNKKNKKAIEQDMLVWTLIAIFVLVVAVILYIVWKDKIINAIKYAIDFFRFRG